MRPRSSSGAAACAVLLVLLVSAGPPDPPPAGPSTLLLTFAGDVMHHELTASMANYDLLYDSVREALTTDDLSFANIEFPIDATRRPSGYPRFNGTANYVDAAVRAGFDVFSLANNHSFDWGPAATVATARLFDQLARDSGVYHNGLRTAGAPAGSGGLAQPRGYTGIRGDAPIGPTIIHRNGWIIGFVSITAFSNIGGASRYVNMVDYRSPTQRDWFLNAVTEWKSHVDLLVVSVHAGVEYQTVPDEEKARFFREIAVAGADIVWGHHPHVLQPWEIVSDGRRDSLIMYSTGNFISAQRRRQSPHVPMGMWAPTGDTALFQVVVRRDQGRVTVESVRTPMLTTVDEPGGLVLRTFDDVLSRQLPIQWRAFYLARFSALSRLLRPVTAATAHRAPES